MANKDETNRNGNSSSPSTSRMPRRYLERRTAMFVQMTQGKGKPWVYGAMRKEKS